ncbi:MAG: hypothetical protein Q8S73_33825 [Deltaproteobacteria bacterium]|nr:hypothetical protein [Myxococcales bacterium]MDP3219126.1 hypothetical protein [Deltaproteobacteria bacterium]
MLELLDRIARTLPVLAEPVVAIVVGGTAVHFYSPLRVSSDVEAIFSHRLLLPPDLVLRWTDDDGASRTLVYDPGFFRDLALIHPDHERDAVDLDIVLSGRLRVRVLSPVDLALSKLARWGARDQSDVETLARAGLLTVEALRARAEEALSYFVGDTRWVRMHIEQAATIVEVATEGP